MRKEFTPLSTPHLPTPSSNSPTSNQPTSGTCGGHCRHNVPRNITVSLRHPRNGCSCRITLPSYLPTLPLPLPLPLQLQLPLPLPLILILILILSILAFHCSPPDILILILTLASSIPSPESPPVVNLSAKRCSSADTIPFHSASTHAGNRGFLLLRSVEWRENPLEGRCPPPPQGTGACTVYLAGPAPEKQICAWAGRRT